MSDIPAPAWSVVVPSYGRGAQLPGLLEALSALVPPAGGFEVVLVDDGSPAPLDDVVAPYHDRLRLVLHRQANAGPASARNTGVARARGRWIALTDDDCRPEPRWLVAMAEALGERDTVLVGGRTVNGHPELIGAAASQTLVDYLQAAARDRGDGRLDFVPSNNMALSKTAFERLGGFDEAFPLAAGEDRDFCDRWLAEGGVIEQADEACIAHFHALTLKAFWRQHYHYGRGAHRVHAMRRGRADGPAADAPEARTFESLSFYRDLVFFPLAETRPDASRQCAMLLLSQLATTAGYLGQALSARAER